MAEQNKQFINYSNKMMVTRKQPGITVIVLDDNAKRGGDTKVIERVRDGVNTNAAVWAILKGKK